MRNRRADVVAGALAVLDDEGLDGLTMRNLAGRLGVQAGALYRHFPNKRALLEAVAEKLVEGVGAPLPEAPWDEQLTTVAHRLRHALLGHRDAARVVAGTYVLDPNTVLAGKTSVDVLIAAGLPAARAAAVVSVLAHYVLGHTIEEQAQADLKATGDWDTKRATARQRAGTAYADTLGVVLDESPDEQFDYGITTFIDGVRHQLPPNHPTEPAPKL